MEVPDIELVSQCKFGFASQFRNFQLADFVGERLAGPDDVAIDFSGNFQFLFGGVFDHEVDGLLPVPAQVVHSGIDD